MKKKKSSVADRAEYLVPNSFTRSIATPTPRSTRGKIRFQLRILWLMLQGAQVDEKWKKNELISGKRYFAGILRYRADYYTVGDITGSSTSGLPATASSATACNAGF